MKAEEMNAITAIGTLIAAVGTVGTLFVSLGDMKLELKERRRGAVRGVTSHRN